MTSNGSSSLEFYLWIHCDLSRLSTPKVVGVVVVNFFSVYPFFCRVEILTFELLIMTRGYGICVQFLVVLNGRRLTVGKSGQ